MKLIDRHAECEVLDRLVEAIRAGQSRALVLRGEPGVGKTALLDYVAAEARDCRIVRTAGVQSEMELAFAALQQLCAPLLESPPCLPEPQRDALQVALGVSPGPPPDRFLVGLAVLGLLADIAEQQPLGCLVDDEQWLDRASAQVLGFVARRLVAESVGVVFAARVTSTNLAGLPELTVEGLRQADARALLDAALPGPLDIRVRDQIIAETGGNPLALLELPRGLTAQQLAGGFGLPGAVRLSGVEESFRRRIDVLPAQARLLLVIAAAEPIGDAALVWRAAAQLGISAKAARPAGEAGLVEFDTRVRFRHPLVRSAVYGSASPQERNQAHAALAEVTDPQLDPDRRAWHRAQASPGPDDDVAAELERSAGRAQARGGLAAAAAFLQRATLLTIEPQRRADRALAAATANVQAGAFDAAEDLLYIAEAEQLNEFQRARVDLIRAELAFVTSRGSDAPALLLRAARRLEPINADLCRATYLRALAAGMFGARLALGGGALEVARAAAAAPPPPHPPGVPDLLLDGIAAHYTRGYAAGVPLLRKALDVFGTEMSSGGQLQLHYMAALIALHLWDDERCHMFSDHWVRLARSLGALSELPLALNFKVFMLVLAGDLTAAEASIQELQATMEATGINLGPYAALAVAAVRGRQTEAAALIAASNREVIERGEGAGISSAEWASAVLNNGLANYQEAMTAALRACAHPWEFVTPTAAAVELVEAAARSGRGDVAADALTELAEVTTVSGTDWACGVEARSRALISEGDAAERQYRESIARLGRTRVRADLARAHLVYGEWLRRQRRRIDARAQLNIAHKMFEAMGMEAFAERALRELRATGETARKRSVASGGQKLTAQEAQIARMARDGLSNPEIGARLFISARTVQYHLQKVFTKLGIESRTQLDRVLND